MCNILNELIKVNVTGASKGNGVSSQKICDVLNQLINRPTVQFTLLESDKRDLLLEAIHNYQRLKGYTLSERLKLIGRIKVLFCLGEINQTEKQQIIKGLLKFDESNLEDHIFHIIFNTPIGPIPKNIPFDAETPIIEIPPMEQYNSHKFFMGWYDNPEFTGDKITTIDPSKYDTSVSLYAKWVDIKDIISGERFNILLMSDRTAYISGVNDDNLFGFETPELDNPTFMKIPMFNNIKFIGRSYGNVFIITTDGHLYGSGLNTLGQLGIGHTKTPSGFVRLSCEYEDKFIFAGGGRDNILIIGESGTLYGSGYNRYGHLGLENEEDVEYYTTFTKIPGIEPHSIKEIVFGQYHTGIHTKSDSLFMTGYNSNGQVGVGYSGADTNLYSFTRINKFDGNVAKLAIGGGQTIVLTKNGTVYGTGSNGVGQLGTGDIAHRNSFIKLNYPNKDRIVDIFCTGGVTCLLTSKGRIINTGKNLVGQLTDPLAPDGRIVFDYISFDKEKITQMYGDNNMIYIRGKSGIIYASGKNARGQLGIGTFENTFIPTRITNLPY